MEIKFATGLEDPELLKRVMVSVKESCDDSLLRHLETEVADVVKNISNEFYKGNSNEALKNLLSEILTSGKYDFNQAFCTARYLTYNGVMPSYEQYPLFREFSVIAGKYFQDNRNALFTLRD